MSETNGTTREGREWGTWLFRYILGGVVLLTCWFGREIWQGQRDIRDQIQIINIDRAGDRASKFTSGDWNAARSIIDSQFNANERRIFKLENNSERVNESLGRIEQKLGTK